MSVHGEFGKLKRVGIILWFLLRLIVTTTFLPVVLELQIQRLFFQRFQPLELFHGNSQHETITEDWNNHGSCLFYLAVKQILRQVTSLEFDDIRSIDTEVN